jgi:hypothetical protein
MNKFSIYGALQKVEEADDGTLKIEGIASGETVDSAGETILASAMKAARGDFLRHGTGALREMHGLSAAGTVDSVDVSDDGNTYIAATVVDPVACTKVLKGVYKGLSVGGKVLARDPKDRKTITSISWSELSLVDRPCLPTAVLTLARADVAVPLGQHAITGDAMDAVTSLRDLTLEQTRDAMALMSNEDRAALMVSAIIRSGVGRMM